MNEKLLDLLMLCDNDNMTILKCDIVEGKALVEGSNGCLSIYWLNKYTGEWK